MTMERWTYQTLYASSSFSSVRLNWKMKRSIVLQYNTATTKPDDIMSGFFLAEIYVRFLFCDKRNAEYTSIKRMYVGKRYGLSL